MTCSASAGIFPPQFHIRQQKTQVSLRFKAGRSGHPAPLSSQTWLGPPTRIGIRVACLLPEGGLGASACRGRVQYRLHPWPHRLGAIHRASSSWKSLAQDVHSRIAWQ